MKKQQEKIEYLSECQIEEYEIIGNYYIGFHRMIYGVRIRAGSLFESSCNIDICCGPGTYLKHIVKDLYSKKMMVNRKNHYPIFRGLKSISEIKPIYNDPKFMRYLSNLAEELKKTK